MVASRSDVEEAARAEGTVGRDSIRAERADWGWFWGSLALYLCTLWQYSSHVFLGRRKSGLGCEWGSIGREVENRRETSQSMISS